MPMAKKAAIPISLISVSIAVPVSAAVLAPEPDAAGPNAPRVEEVVVSASRIPMAISKVGASITVLTSEAIKASQAMVVSDLLARTPGVDFSRNGGVGGVTFVRIRGAEGDQTMTVIDGVKLNDPSSPGGGFNFANLMIGDITGIEVLRGAQSTLWGSQAIGGVVSIVTAMPEKSLEISADIEGGSFQTGYGRIGLGGKSEHMMWRISGGYYTTDGISTFADGTEQDGYHHAGVNGRFRVEIADGISADVRTIYSRGRVELDGFPAPFFAFADTGEYSVTEEFVGYAGLNFDLWSGRLRNRIAFGYTDNDRQNFHPDQAVTQMTFDSRGENERWEYQGTFSIAENWATVFGAEAEKSSIYAASPSSFDPNPAPLESDVSIYSGYAQIQGEVLPGLTLTGGLRHDSHDTFGARTLGQASVAWAVNDGNTVLRASFGQGFKAPTLYQLYSDFGNTALRPEVADSWDAGIEHRFADGAATVSATWFLRKARDLVSITFCPGSPFCAPGRFGVYENTAKARAQGVELIGTVQLDAFTLQANYTLTDTENTSPGDANRGNELNRRPRHMANVSVAYAWPYGISTGLGLTYVGETYNDAANTFLLPSHTLVDLRASAPVTEAVEIYGRIENLFDKAHVTARDYGSVGRGAYIGARVRY